MSIDEDRLVHFLIESCFYEKGGVKYDDGIRRPRGQPLYLRSVRLEHPGVEAIVEPQPLFRVIEHDFSEFPAVNAPVRLQDAGPEVLRYFFPCFQARLKELAHDPVGVYDVRAEILEYPCDEAFSACDPTGESDYKHGKAAPSQRLCSLSQWQPQVPFARTGHGVRRNSINIRDIISVLFIIPPPRNRR